MKFRITYKILCAFLLTSLVVVGLTVGVLPFFMHRNFQDYLNRVEMEQLNQLSAALADFYQQHQGWEQLRSDRQLWRNFLMSNIRPERIDGEPSDSPPSQFENRPDRQSDKSRPPPPRQEGFFMFPRIFLLDEHRKPVAGRSIPQENESLLAIRTNDRIVGWLGLNQSRPPKTPPERTFIRRQYILFCTIGGGVSLLTSLMAFLLARHILAPVKKLMAGTQALADRRFATRIEVKTSDELGWLATNFNAMAKTLDEYERIRQQWFSDISHELRTPLAILRGEIEAIQDGVRPMDRKALDSLHSEVLHVSKIVDDLHELSLADAQALSFTMVPVDPLSVLKETIESFKPRFHQKQITIKNEFTSEATARINGDKRRLMQLFANLLENSLRYTESPGTLTIRQARVDEEMVFVFEESGPGVPEEALSHLFDRLYRVDKSRSRALGGSGLGLSICKSIVESHGGTISALNLPAPYSGGLRIEIRLPLD